MTTKTKKTPPAVIRHKALDWLMRNPTRRRDGITVQALAKILGHTRNEIYRALSILVDTPDVERTSTILGGSQTHLYRYVSFAERQQRVEEQAQRQRDANLARPLVEYLRSKGAASASCGRYESGLVSIRASELYDFLDNNNVVGPKRIRQPEREEG